MTKQLYIHLTWEDPANGDIFSHASPLPVTIGRSHRNTIVLNSSVVSRQQAKLEGVHDQLFIQDLQSGNGTWVNGQRIDRVQLQTGDVFQIGPFYFEVTLEMRDEAATAVSIPSDPIVAGTIQVDRSALTEALAQEKEHTVLLNRSELLDLQQAQEKEEAEPSAPSAPPTFPPPAFLAARQVSMADLAETGLPVDETTYLTLGGGLGSFAWVDYLLISGADPGQVTAIGVDAEPHGRYRRLCRQSQIPDPERLRSDSGSTMDNIWGWPGYALREMWRALKQGQVGEALRLGWQIFGEPTLYEAYTPRAGDVYASVEREMARIGWDAIWRYGRIRAIRQTDDGRYAVAYSQTSAQAGRQHRFIVAPTVHIAIGYPGVRFLPDLQAYRMQTGDFRTVVNAYEEHAHVYQQLRQQGGTLVLRGRGIVSSRILQRLHEARQESGQAIHVLHLMRAPNPAGAQYGRSHRHAQNHWELQPFNWPKSSFGGDFRFMLEAADDAGRDQLLNDLGGVTTADRHDWRHIVANGLAQGWYQIRFGQVDKVSRQETGRLAVTVTGRTAVQEQATIEADFIIDATGLNATIEHHPLLRDLLDTYELPRNPKGNLAVTNDFEVTGMRNGNGRVYASGAMTLGGPFAPVDSFVGLQYSAQRSLDALAKQGAPGLRRLNGFRSLKQWLKWARGVAP